MVKKLIKKYILNNSRGFTLIEVMMAMTIFAVFITAILMSQSANVNHSIRMEEDLNLHNLAEMKMNEVLLNPPKFTNATDNDVKTGTFDIDDFKDYKFKVEFAKTKFPNFSQLIGSEDDDQESKDDATNRLVLILHAEANSNPEIVEI